MATITPCDGTCTLNQHQFCVGCRRHISEIALWSGIGDADARRRMARLAGRDIEREWELGAVGQAGKRGTV